MKYVKKILLRIELSATTKSFLPNDNTAKSWKQMNRRQGSVSFSVEILFQFSRHIALTQNMNDLGRGDSEDSVEILDFPHPKPLCPLCPPFSGDASHKEGGALTAHYGSESSPSLILGMLAIEMARRSRGHVDIDLRDGGVFQQSPANRPYQLSASCNSAEFDTQPPPAHRAKF